MHTLDMGIQEAITMETVYNSYGILIPFGDPKSHHYHRDSLLQGLLSINSTMGYRKGHHHGERQFQYYDSSSLPFIVVKTSSSKHPWHSGKSLYCEQVNNLRCRSPLAMLDFTIFTLYCSSYVVQFSECWFPAKPSFLMLVFVQLPEDSDHAHDTAITNLPIKDSLEVYNLLQRIK